MRGGLDDALDKLARRDELRRRAAGENGGTPPAVTELVEAIAAVIARHPQLGVTVGVEGAGDPVLLHFGFADGVVQVSADNTVATRAAEAAPVHADFEIDVDDAPAYAPEQPRASHDDQDRFGPADFDYHEPPTAERPFVAPSSTPDPYAAHPESVQHPFAATPPPPVPPQAYAPPQPHPEAPFSAPPFPEAPFSAPPFSEAPFSAPPFPTASQAPEHPPMHAHAEPQPASAPRPAAPFPPQAAPGAFTQPQATVDAFAQPQAAADAFARPQAAAPGFPPPLPKPIPLQVERPEETEQAARRLAALLRNDPTLLDAPRD
ncbi:hypothetical protein [Actinoplanes sp. DH11]|uniref:hypothetical protein n=1 Tax=Actinoplanes sp. DH11 TaxID=2857011 RepID=UPI001E351FCA|nr:hypothetical protein [Actinoplanes sp. DH11]